MVIAFLRGKNNLLSTSQQQSFIVEYAIKNSIAVKLTEIDNDPSSELLENRGTLLDMLNSINQNDTILIYDLWVFSQKVGELAKVFDCILRHKVIVHVCKQNLTINDQVPSGVLINLLSSQRDLNLSEKKQTTGRPKGSFSKSKFDKYKSQIVTMLEKEFSVSEIAKKLEVSRSSLKDYINSRLLKDIALSNDMGDTHVGTTNQSFILPDPDKCPLTDKKI